MKTMIAKFVLLFVALLPAVPLFSQDQEMARILSLDTKEKVFKQFGKPKATAEFGGDFQSWQYQFDVGDHDDFSHQVVFRKSTGALVSFSRNFEVPRTVKAFFPETESKPFFYKEDGKPDFPILARRLSRGRVLLAVGISKGTQPTMQLVLMRETELRHFYPWLRLNQ